MAKLIYPINMSLDGFMEDSTGNFNWSVPDNETFNAWTDFQRSIGIEIYGRRMYETMVYWETANAQTIKDFENPAQLEAMVEFANLWRMSDKIVYSHTLDEVSSAKTKLEHEFEADAIQNLKDTSKANLTISGPNLAFQAMHMGLVDELYLHVHPINLGSGKSALPENLCMKLELIHEQRFNSGVVQLHYRVLE
jgi:dihydrofolate reductase